MWQLPVIFAVTRSREREPGSEVQQLSLTSFWDHDSPSDCSHHELEKEGHSQAVTSVPDASFPFEVP